MVGDVGRELSAFIDSMPQSARFHTEMPIEELITAIRSLSRIGLVTPEEGLALVRQAELLKARYLGTDYSAGFKASLSVAPLQVSGASTHQDESDLKSHSKLGVRDEPQAFPISVVGMTQPLVIASSTVLSVEFWSDGTTMRYTALSQDRNFIEWEASDDIGTLYSGHPGGGYLRNAVWVQEWIFVPQVDSAASRISFALFKELAGLGTLTVEIPKPRPPL